MNSYHVKKGDKVQVIAGNFKGQNATIKAVLTDRDRVVLELAGEHKIGKRTVKKSKLNPNGGLVERSVSVHVSNVALTEEGKAARNEKPAAAGKTE